MSLNIIKHVLPTGKAWALTIDKQLRQFFQGLANALIDPVKLYFDLTWEAIFPDTTNELDAWEAQFNIPGGTLLESERRSRLTAAWRAQGGQSPGYIQDTLQANGFDVYVHDWWEEGSNPPIPHNPFITLSGGGAVIFIGECGEPIAQCGEVTVECGNTVDLPGYALVNKILSTQKDFVVVAGEVTAQCGEPEAECGNYFGYVDVEQTYGVSPDPNTFPFYVYIGDAVFGDVATVDADRREEFENLCLKICPTQLWIGVLVTYV